MSDIIKLLPDSVANQIAAGEVIQRPASVIKELVENAVDAGARHIQIVIKDAGRTLIQVVDDGIGMSETDARMAFERHATSKITQAADLFTLRTMGFRGEALPSIAAVSQIDLRTMPRDASLGTRIIINGSRVESQEPEACMPGTNMMVKNLFFNIPARRKFLKKDSVELANIMREFERLALVNPGIEFTVSHNDSTLHHLLPATFKQRIIDLFGKALERQIIPVETDTSLVAISGYIGLPEYARRRGPLQYLLVNGRNMRHPYFHKAILQCYADLIPSDQQPCYFLNFTVDPETIDVNIHPTKNEIKFENEQPIWQILTAAVKESLNRFNAVPAIDFDRDDAPDIPAFIPDARAPHDVTVDRGYNPFATSQPRGGACGCGGTGFSRRQGAPDDWQKLYASFTGNAEPQDDKPGELAIKESTLPIDDGLTDDFSQTGGTVMIKNRYIVTPSRDGMLIIDARRAHIAVLFDCYVNSAACSQPLESQQVLFPETITLSPSQSSVLDSIADEIERLGYALDEATAADGTRSIIAVPAAIAKAGGAADALHRIIDTVITTGDDPTADIRRSIALSMAQSATLRPGQPLNSAEREQLVASLMSLPNPRYTPDGLKIMALITTDDISRLL